MEIGAYLRWFEHKSANIFSWKYKGYTYDWRIDRICRTEREISCRSKQTDKSVFSAAEAGRHEERQNRELFIPFFDLLGYDLKINEDQGVIGIVNQFGTGRLALGKYESIFLLILRILYVEMRM